MARPQPRPRAAHRARRHRHRRRQRRPHRLGRASGILDQDDRCRNTPEDFDGFEDDDGCPELDNDRDKILDADDLCPFVPEDFDNFEDKDGCPDKNDPRAVIIENDGSIDILKPINFEYGKAKIKRDSYYILDAIAAVLQGNTTIQLLEITGHTDERGDDAYNLDLSDRRAAAVLRYLTEKGVDSKRLESQGYGETRPKDPRSTRRPTRRTAGSSS